MAVLISYKVTSDKCKVRVPHMGVSIEDYRKNLTPDLKYMTNFTIEVFLDDDSQKIMDFGLLRGVYFEAEALFSNELSFTALCAMASPGVYDMAVAVADMQGNIKPSICRPEHNMAYIKEMVNEEHFRGNKAGQYLLNNLAPLLSHSLNLRPHVCIVLPYPQAKAPGGALPGAAENVAAEQPYHIGFYEKAGYTKLDGSDYMYKKFGQP